MRAIWLVFLLVALRSMTGQNKSLILLSDEFKSIQQRFNVVFSFNPKAIEGLKIQSRNYNSLGASLLYLDSVTAFKYNLADDKNVLVEFKVRGKNLKVIAFVKGPDDLPISDVIVIHHKEQTYTTTDVNGRFELLTVWHPQDSLQFEFIGYCKQKVALTDLEAHPGSVVRLNELMVNLSGITISGYMTNGINYAEENQSIVLTPDKLGLLPAETETDLFSSLQALPGINSADDKAGNLSLRGSDADKVLISFDNIPIYHRGHYFGAFSPFNTQMLQDVSVQRSGIAGPENGGRVNGQLNMRTKNYVPDSASYSGGFATSYAFVNLFTPIVKKKVALLLGARSSYPFNWNSPKIDAINEFIFLESEVYPAITGASSQTVPSFAFRFYDFNAKLIYDITDKQKVTASFLKIKDHLGINLFNSPAAAQVSDTAVLNNWGLNVSLASTWNRRVSTTNEFTKSIYFQDFVSFTYGRIGLRIKERFSNTTDNVKWRSATTIQLKGQQEVRVGYDGELIKLIPIHTLLQPPTPVYTVGRPAQEFVHAVFFNYGLAGINRKINLSAGLRLNYYTGTQKFYPEPRLLMNYRFSKQLTIKSSVGQYYQFINVIPGSRVSTISGVSNFNWNLSNNSDIPVVEGRQIMGGAVFNKKKLVVDLECYYKEVNELTAYNFFNSNDDTTFIHGSYKNLGLDLLVKKSVKNFEGWISYSYSFARTRFETVEFESFWNQPHIFKAVLGYQWKQFKISIGWRYRSGIPALYEYRNAYNAGKKFAPAGTTPPIVSNPNRNFSEESVPLYLDRFPDSHQLDVSVNYKLQPKSKKFLFNFGATIQNVYNNKAIIGQIERPVPNQNLFIRVNKYSMGFAPSLIVSVNF